MFSRVINNISCYDLNNRDILKEFMNWRELILKKVLLDSRATELVISSEFSRKQGFKLKKIERPIYVRNMDSFFNKERPIEHMVKINIYYQEYREKMEINVIRGQKWSVILGILWLTCHNPEIDWRTGEIKMTRCSEECRKQWKLKQRKLEWQK